MIFVGENPPVISAIISVLETLFLLNSCLEITPSPRTTTRQSLLKAVREEEDDSLIEHTDSEISEIDPGTAAQNMNTSKCRNSGTTQQNSIENDLESENESFNSEAELEQSEEEDILGLEMESVWTSQLVDQALKQKVRACIFIIL